MIALLSVLPPLSPRAIQARNTFSRRSRRAENCRNGSTLDRPSVMTCLPAMSRSVAAERAACRTKSGRPARSSSPSRTRGEPLLGTFVEGRARPSERYVLAFEYSRLLGIEFERLAPSPEIVDAAEQRRVEHDAVPVAGPPPGTQGKR